MFLIILLFLLNNKKLQELLEIDKGYLKKVSGKIISIENGNTKIFLNCEKPILFLKENTIRKK